MVRFTRDGLPHEARASSAVIPMKIFFCSTALHASVLQSGCFSQILAAPCRLTSVPASHCFRVTARESSSEDAVFGVKSFCAMAPIAPIIAKARSRIAHVGIPPFLRDTEGAGIPIRLPHAAQKAALALSSAPQPVQ